MWSVVNGKKKKKKKDGVWLKGCHASRKLHGGATEPPPLLPHRLSTPTLHSDRLTGLSAALHAHDKNIFTKYFSQCGVLVYRMDRF